MAHANARLGPAGRRELVRLIIEMGMSGSARPPPALGLAGDSASVVAAGLAASSSGAQHRRVDARSHQPPASLAAQRRAPSSSAQVCEARERTGWGPRLIAGETGVAHSTVHAILQAPWLLARAAPTAGAVPSLRVALPRRSAAHGRQALPALSPARSRRHRRSRKTGAEKRGGLGHDYFHAIVDDHSRLAYGELLTDERAPPPPRSANARWPGSPATASALAG